MASRRIFLLLPVFFLALGLAADDGFVPQVRFSTTLKGRSLEVKCRIPSGFYTYIKSAYSSPLKVTVTSSDGLTFGTPVLPQGHVKGDATIVDGTVTVTVPVTSLGSASAGSRVTLQIRVAYQLCDASRGICHPPQEASFSVYATIPAGGTPDYGTAPPPGGDDGGTGSTGSAGTSGSDTGGDYSGTQSGPDIKVSDKGAATGIAPLSHTKRDISVKNRVRIRLKGRPDSQMYSSVYYWKDGKWHYVQTPWESEWQEKDGSFTIDISFPEAAEYSVSIRGKRKSVKGSYTYLFHYKVKASSAADKWSIPVRTGSQFTADGFRLVSHHKAFIRTGKKLRVTVKGLPGSWLYCYLIDRRGRSYKYLYTPWEKSSNDGKGTYHFDMLFPGTGRYQLSIRGRRRSKDKKSHAYFSYEIECTDAYTSGDMPVQLSGNFRKLGFTMSGLSHTKYRFNAGSYAMVTLRGKPGLKLKAHFSRSKPWKYFKNAPRVFYLPQNGVYRVWFWFPEAGTYKLGIQGDVTKKNDRYRKWDTIASYEVTATGGYSDRDLDVKMGNFTGEEKYRPKPKGGTEKVVYGSAGDLMWVTDMAEAERISRTQNRILMILHSATWCGYCKKLKKETFRHPDVVRYAKNRIVAIEVGSHPIRNMALYNSKYKKYRGGIPSVTFISPQGKKLITRTGYSAGKWYVKVLKNVVAMGSGLVERYERYHKLGYTSYSFKLIELYQSLGQKYKASKVIKDLLTAGKIPEKDKPKYYYQVASASWGSTTEKYYRKIIDGYGPGTGYYWYYAVYKLAIHLYGGGYGGYNAKALNENERNAISFITPYIGRNDLSLMWRSWYAQLVPGIRTHAAAKRRKKGWSPDAQKKQPWFDQSRGQDASRDR